MDDRSPHALGYEKRRRTTKRTRWIPLVVLIGVALTVAVWFYLKRNDPTFWDM